MRRTKGEGKVRRILTVFFAYFGILAAPVGAAADELTYGTGSWDAQKWGNHRVVIRVDRPADAVRLRILWRRRDYNPQDKNIVIMDAENGQRIRNVYRVHIDREWGDLVIQPRTVPGKYFVYYMPYVTSGSKHYPKVDYQAPEETAEPQWLERHGLAAGNGTGIERHPFPEAKVLEIQSIDEFNSFYPMEVIATRSEVQQLLARHAGAAYLLFPEDRRRPIRLGRDLPLRWIRTGAKKTFRGEAARGEFYAFQVGIWAVEEDIEDIEVFFSDLKSDTGGSPIPAAALRCFNTGGVDWTGKAFKKVCTVGKGEIRPLWCGVQVPLDITPGEYCGKVTVVPRGRTKREVDILLDITTARLQDGGDSEPWRHSRLRWLDSRIALDNEVIPPFTPLEVDWKSRTVGCLGRRLRLAETGFPASITSLFTAEMTGLIKDSYRGREVLSGPVELVVERTDGSKIPWKASGFEPVGRAPGAVTWKADGKASPLVMHCRARMEFDGCIEFEVVVQAIEDAEVGDIRLEIPLTAEVARYMMGLGFKGGPRPSAYEWKWDVKKNQDSLWIGDVNAGLQCSFKAENYFRPLNTNFYHSKPLKMPPSWFNNGRGGIRLTERGQKSFLVTAYSGARAVKAGEKLHFNFRLILTPFKPMAVKSHWRHRYFHRFEPLEEIIAAGANTVNVHHATPINPYINYPFLRPGRMKDYIDRAHDRGLKVKIYYTVRELSNRAPELFALRSLGDEILSVGPGGGFAWLQEHLGENYIAGWLVPDLEDAAVINSGVSRWHNYYLEGLNWLVKNVAVDGLYIDDVAFDRTVMKRVRKILSRGRPEALIDLHSANQYNVRDGFANSANLYLEHFPFLDRLWFGEYFDYDSPPDFWLVEMSGIPFGLMGEMLQDGGNPWRGMLYGMTSRLPWSGDPGPIWKVWDDFGIQGSRMVGYWVPDCPVRTDHPRVLATAYVKPGTTLIALASWSQERDSCRLLLDWKSLGLDPRRSTLRAPAVKDFQAAAHFPPGQPIPVEPGRGWLIILGPE